MRIGELRVLRGEYVFDDYILVAGQYTRHGYTPNTKTKTSRNIPINPAVKRELDERIAVNGNDYIFSDDKGVTPIRSEVIERTAA
jgi:integrase